MKPRKRTRAERANRERARLDRLRRHMVIVWNGVRISRKRPSRRFRGLQREQQMRYFYEALRHGIAVVEVQVSPPGGEGA